LFEFVSRIIPTLNKQTYTHTKTIQQNSYLQNDKSTFLELTSSNYSFSIVAKWKS